MKTKPDWKCSIYGQAPLPHASLRYQAGFAAVLIGLGIGALRAAIPFVTSKSRPWPSAGVDNAADDPFVRRLAGELTADLAAAYALTLATGDLLDAHERGEIDRTALAAPDLCGEGRRLTRRRSRHLRNIRLDGHSIGGPRSWLRSVLAQCPHPVAARSGRLEAFRAWPARPDWVGIRRPAFINSVRRECAQLFRAPRESIWLASSRSLLHRRNRSSLLIVVAGANPLQAMKGLLDGAFGDRYAVAETIVQAVPIAIVALGVAPALRAGIFPVGSEGQLAIGAVTATATVFASERCAGGGGASGRLYRRNFGRRWLGVDAGPTARASQRQRNPLDAADELSRGQFGVVAGAHRTWHGRSGRHPAQRSAAGRSTHSEADRRHAPALGRCLRCCSVLAALAYWIRSARGLGLRCVRDPS